MTTVAITSHDGGRFNSYVAEPAATPHGLILVVPKVFGVNGVMRDLADGFAQLGYLAACPDIFWRQEPDVELMDTTPEEIQRAMQLYAGIDWSAAAQDLGSTRSQVRAAYPLDGGTGIVAWGHTAPLAWHLAGERSVDAGVIYYGNGLSTLEVPPVAPLLLHVAADDPFESPDAQRETAELLATNDQATIHRYEQAKHMFTYRAGPNYLPADAALAEGRTAGFLQRHLRA